MPDPSPEKRHKPRKMPRQARSGATVDAILEAAARILETRGFEGYTTNAIAKLAGVSIGSLYQYFPTKEAITASLIAREAEALWQDIAAIDFRAGGRQPLEQLVRIAVDRQMRRPALARLLDLEEQRLPANEGTRHRGQQLHDVVGRCVDCACHATGPREAHAVGDVIAIIRGLVDAAGMRGERDRTVLLTRVNHAVFGYLTYQDGTG
jgi:AcrR family transcriptional regulator